MHQRSILSTLVLCTLLLLTLVAAYDTVRATPSEPYLVKDLFANNSASPNILTAINGILYFEGSSDSGRGLAKSDGTEAGTDLIYPGLVNLRELTTVNSHFFFAAMDGVYGWELWKSDGTTSGTMLVKDIMPGLPHSTPEQLTNVNGTLYFIVDDGVVGKELWKSDGTEAGTMIVKDIYPGSTSSRPYDLTEMNGLLYFRNKD